MSPPLAPLDAARLAAGVVLFHPDLDRVEALVGQLAGEVGRVVVFANSPLDPDAVARLRHRGDVVVIEAPDNLGIGAALDAIVGEAGTGFFDAVILFDQDSRPPPGMVGRLAVHHARLLAAGHRPAVVAPEMVPYADASDASKAPTYRWRRGDATMEPARQVDFVPTSGSFIAIGAYRAIGPFRTDYFIDGIDVEWSWRAWSRGFSCWVARDCPMPHAVGEGVIAWPVVGLRMPLQKPFRMYCTVRNALFGLRLAHVPLGWKARQLAYLPIQMLAYAAHHRFSRPILGALTAGVRDGLLGRLGPPRGLGPPLDSGGSP